MNRVKKLTFIMTAALAFAAAACSNENTDNSSDNNSENDNVSAFRNGLPYLIDDDYDDGDEFLECTA